MATAGEDQARRKLDLNTYMRWAYYALTMWALVAMLNGQGVDFGWWGKGATGPLRVVGTIVILAIVAGEVTCVWQNRKRTRG